jgi:hypothetical protein
MEQMGVDPQRYVVGNELNSINPETGLPEFFFKKVFKKLKKIFKKFAPVILSVALSMTPLGPILGSAIGSGIGTLIQGGSAKDALKSAAFSGITAGIMSGVGEYLQAPPGTSFGTAFQSGLTKGMPQFGGLGGEKTLSRILGQKVSSLGDPSTRVAAADSSLFKPASFTPSGPTSETIARFGQNIPDLGMEGGFKYLGGTEFSGASPVDQNFRLAVNKGTQGDWLRSVQSEGRIPQKAVETVLKTDKPTLLQRFRQLTPGAQEAYSPKGGGTFYGKGAALAAETELVPRYFNRSIQQYQTMFGEDAVIPQKALFDMYQTAKLNAAAKIPGMVSPGFWQQYGLTGLGLGGIGYAAGFFDEPEQDPFVSTFGERPSEAAIEEARINIARPRRLPATDLTSGQELVPSPFQDFTRRPPATTAFEDLIPVASAHGGEMQNFPPRIGAIAGPGTEKSDDVPAMLSDGEFVMTAQAVRGAGNGSRRQGVKNLYDIMRNFEAVA